MPSGAKKRKAAKRKKEQEQQQLRGVHPPGPRPSLNGGPPHSTQGTDLGEEEEGNMVSHDGRGCENGSDFTSPMEQDNHQCHLEVEDDGEQAEMTGDEKDKIESVPGVAIDIMKAMNIIQNCAAEQPRESSSPQKTDEVVKEIAEVHVAGVEVKKDEVLPTPPLYPIPPTSADVSVSKTETVIIQHLQSEKSEHVLVLGDGPPPFEHKKWEAIGTDNPVERPAPISEEVEQARDSLAESCKLAESVSEAPTNGKEERVICLSDATTEETGQSFKSHHDMKTHEIAGATEVVKSRQLKKRTSWLSCCGLFDVMTGHNG